VKLTIVDPDGDHVAIYVDGKHVDADNGMSHTSRFLRWLDENGIKPADIESVEYLHVDLTDSEANRFPPPKWPPRRLPKGAR
jgi:hypothetical protein